MKIKLTLTLVNEAEAIFRVANMTSAGWEMTIIEHRMTYDVWVHRHRPTVVEIEIADADFSNVRPEDITG